jgi:hypothetical protein
MLGGSCSLCCCSTLALGVVANSNAILNPLLMPRLRPSGGTFLPSVARRLLNGRFASGEPEYDAFLSSGAGFTGLSVAYSMNHYNATVRFMAGYDEQTGSHCFLDLTPLSVRRSGAIGDTFVPAFSYSPTLESLRGIVSYSGNRPISRYSQNGGSYAFDSPANVSESIDLYVSDDSANAIWCMDNKFVNARFGFFFDSAETTLGQLRIPAYGEMNVVVACNGGLFTVVVGSRTFASAQSIWGNRGYAATFTVPGVIANGSNTVGWGARATSERSPHDTTNGAKNYLYRQRSVVSDVISAAAKTPSLSDMTLNLFAATTPCYMRCPDDSGLAGVACSSLSSECRFPVRVNNKGRYFSGTSFFTCDDGDVNSLSATFTRSGSQPSFADGPIDITNKSLTPYVSAAPSACFIGSHSFTQIVGMNAAWKCETLPANTPTFFYYLYGSFSSEPYAKVTYEYRIIGGHMIAEQERIGVSAGDPYAIELFVNVLMQISVTSETFGSSAASTATVQTIRIALNPSEDSGADAGPTHLDGLSLAWSRT